MREIIVAALALALAGNAALAQQKTAAQQKLPAASVAFAKKVASGNAFAIQSSELAQDRAQSSDVKALARQMVAEHTKLGEDFKAAAQAANIAAPLPEQPTAKQKTTLSSLRSAKGAAFDKAYLNGQLKGHKEAVAVLRKYAKSGRTAQLKEFAQSALPTMEQNLSKLTELRKQLAAAGRPTGHGSRAIGPPETAPRPKKH
jgi:putative membrane protein